MTNITRKIVEQSRLLAPVLCEGRCRHLTFICKRNKIIAIGQNSYSKSHPLSNKFNHLNNCRHSEVSAIVNFPYSIGDINRFDIYNVRVNKKGELRLSRPCGNCQSLLNHFNIREIYYSTDSQTFEVMSL